MTSTNRKKQEQVCTIGSLYLRHLDRCLDAIRDQDDQTERLVSSLCTAKNIHLFGFGRSGTAALAMAIRLRHFSAFLPPVWWAGDQVREPVREQDLVILFSQSGTRQEVVLIAGKAKEAGAEIALVTAAEHSEAGDMASLVIRLPRLEGAPVYGGGDFELAAWFFQELLVSALGAQFSIPQAEVGKNHV